MKISNINNTYNTNFKSLIVSDRRMISPVQKVIIDVITCTAINTDIVECLGKRNTDVYAYTNDEEQGLSAKIVFADREGNVYKMPNGKYYISTSYKVHPAPQIDPEYDVYTFDSNVYAVFEAGEQLLAGKLTQKSKDNKESEEIKTIFADKDDGHTFIFEG